MGHRRMFGLVGSVGVAVIMACSGNSGGSAFDGDGGSGSSGGGSGGASGSGSGSGSGSSSGGLGSGSGSGDDSGLVGDVQTTVTSTIYVNTDDSLYSMNAQTMAVTLVGQFAGVSDSSTDSAITDVAVDAAGDVYVNTESVVYKAVLPQTPPGAVQLQKVATIAAKGGARFYALAFTPKDALGAGTGEILIGGDGNGEIWSINLANNGATKDLGSFGPDPEVSGNIMALSGDLVFYMDGSTPKGLATIRSCVPASGSKAAKCAKDDDVLAGVDMTSLATAFSSGTRPPR